MKTIKIPEDLFCDLYLYHVIGSDEPGVRIKAELERKMEALQRHDMYTKYKTAGGEASREEARQRYLDSVGIQRDFRW